MIEISCQLKLYQGLTSFVSLVGTFLYGWDRFYHFFFCIGTFLRIFRITCGSIATFKY